MTNTYSVGDLVQLTATFTQTSNQQTINPSVVTFTVADPDGTETQPATTNTATGVYTTDVSITKAGTWRWRATGTGTAQAAADSAFEVSPNTF